MVKALARGIPAGWCIALAGLTSTWAGTICAIFKPLVFPFGFILIALAGYWLFTGKVYQCFRLEDSSPTIKEVCGCYLGNLIGVCMVIMIAAPIGIASEAIVSAAAAKLVLSPWLLFSSGLACNILIAIATEQTTLVGKFIPIFSFVAVGFEHSIADMFYLLYAVHIGAASMMSVLVVLLIITLGNIVGAFIASIGKDIKES